VKVCLSILLLIALSACLAPAATPTARPTATPAPVYNHRLSGPSQLTYYHNCTTCDKTTISRDAPVAQSVAKTGETCTCDGKSLVGFKTEALSSYFTYYIEPQYLVPK